jgi:hypothetical protein
MRRVFVFTVVALIVATWPAAASAQRKIGRPSYSVKQATPLETPYVVVHYVKRSADAPRLKDDDGDTIPNYVEKVANVANIAFRFYGRKFKAPLPDSAGGNQKIDIYIKRLPQGAYGYTVAPAFTRNGTYMVIDNRLNMAHVTVGSLQQTVAHELFHIFQYSYLPSGRMPAWIAEGSATAMETFVYPKIYDVFRIQAVDYWLNTPHRSLYDERQGCLRCYGGALFWRFIATLGNDTILQEYFGRLYGYEQTKKNFGSGLQPLNEILQRRGQGSLYTAFSRFSYNIYRAGYKPKPLYVLRAQPQVQRTPVRVVQGLSTHYIPIKVPSNARGLAVGTVAGLGPAPNVKLVVGGPKGRVIAPSIRGQGYARLFEVGFRNAVERNNVMLIITSGREEGAAYAVGFATG